MGDDLDAWLAESNLMKRTFRNAAIIAGLIERRLPGKEKTARQMTVNTDLIYDVLRTPPARPHPAPRRMGRRRRRPDRRPAPGHAAEAHPRPDRAQGARHGVAAVGAGAAWRSGANQFTAKPMMPFSPKPRTTSSTRPCGLSRSHRISLGGLDFIPDLSGALYAPDFARAAGGRPASRKGHEPGAARRAPAALRHARVARCSCAAVIAAAKPQRLIFLGDSFHDGAARERIDAARSCACCAPSPRPSTRSGSPATTIPRRPATSAAASSSEVALGPVTLRHEPRPLGDGDARNRRPPSSRGHGGAARPPHPLPLLHRR